MEVIVSLRKSKHFHEQYVFHMGYPMIFIKNVSIPRKELMIVMKSMCFAGAKKTKRNTICIEGTRQGGGRGLRQPSATRSDRRQI